MTFFRDFYYDIKPLLPFSLRMAMRRFVARAQLRKVGNRWPILPRAAKTPPQWTGWPNGKKFALVLTHDVEGPVGLANCEALMQLEMDLGFRSSFNFIPEGSYRVSPKLLGELVAQGFEVGVHDLHHNGKLYRNKKSFDAAAPRINKYLREWNAVGFRSGFMHRNLEWLHALEIEYDMSTFDTDPFEPQPDGANTIFPFWVPSHSAALLDSPPELEAYIRHSPFAIRRSRSGYVELPYTLPQDSTLFLLLEHKNIDIWKRKLDWIAEHGGMALINVHPDYMNFGTSRHNQFPAPLYQEFLQYAQSEYGTSGMNMLPREVATWVRTGARNASAHPALAGLEVLGEDS